VYNSVKVLIFTTYYQWR